MARKQCELVSNIYLSEVKPGQYIQLETDDGKLELYVVSKTGQDYRLIPIDIKNIVTINMYSIHQPVIINLFDAKTGNCLKHKIEKEGSEEDDY